MSLIEIDWNPKRKQLRSFGKIALAASVVISLLLYLLKGVAIQWCLIIFTFGCMVFIISMISIKLTKMIYLGMIILTMPIGFVVSFIVMAAFYYLLLAPLGLIFRLIGRDPLYRRFDPTAKSYWLSRQP
ncbi:MAG: SxtJ family membrane protein, partial [Planctomycetota bacterium]